MSVSSFAQTKVSIFPLGKVTMSEPTVLDQTNVPWAGYWPDQKLCFLPETDGSGWVCYWGEGDTFRTKAATTHLEDHIANNNWHMAFGRDVNKIDGFNDGGSWILGIRRLDNGKLVAFCHVESHWPEPSPAYRSIGVTYSSDNGLTWEPGKRILATDYPKPEEPIESGVGDGCVIWIAERLQYICYYQEDGGCLTMAASSDPEGAAGTWKKWDGKDFTIEGCNQETQLGGRGVAIKGLESVPGSNPSVMWNDYLNCWVMAYSKWGGDTYLSFSKDGINWESPVLLIDSQGQGYPSYPNLVSDQGDLIGGKSLRLYYARNYNEWAIRELVYRTIEFDNSEQTIGSIVRNSDLEGDDVSCFYSKVNGAKNEAVVTATIVDGAGKGGSRGIVIRSTDNPSQSWDTQFFVRMPQSLPAGTRYRLSFDYKASQDAYVTMESHAEPGEYIWYSFDNITFTPSWQHYERVATITEEESTDEKKMRTITFDLAHIETATTYYFDNIIFEIEAEQVKEPVIITADNKTMTYGDDMPELTYMSTGAELNGTPKLSTTATKTSPTGIYPITVKRGTVTNDAVIFVSGTLNITQAPLTVGVQDLTITEGDDIPTFTLTYDGWRNNDNANNAFITMPVASTTAMSSSVPGVYPITVSGGESTNYALNYQSGTLTILKDENPASYRTYPLSIDMFHEWDGCTATSKVINMDCGEIHVGASLGAGSLVYGDVSVFYTHYADVTKYNQLLIEGTPGMELRVLLNRLEVGNGGGDANGGSWTELNPVIGGDGKAIVDLPDFEFVHLNAIKTGWGSPEGVIESLYLVKGKIEKPVTITANDLTMVYGDEVPTLTYSSEGGELNGTPKLSTTATKKSPVGTYPIKVEKGSLTNEQVTYVEGTLTITQAPLTVGVQNMTITEGDAIPSFTLTYSGFRNDDTEANAFTTKPTATTMATSSSKAGTYPISVSGGESKNYALTYMQGTLTIKEKKQDPIADGIYPLTADMFHEWDGCTATSNVVNENCGGEIHVGEVLNAGNLVYGGTSVFYTQYADLTGYDVLAIVGTPGMEFRVLLNRLEVGNGGGDDHGGSWTELNPVIGDDGKAIVNLPDFEFVHLNAIKTGWGSPEGVIKDLYLVKGKIEQPVTITANDLTMVYGDDVPMLTYSFEGGELEGTPKLSTTATKKSPVGTYPIKVEQGTVTNTKATYVDGTLTITKAPLTIKAGTYTRKQGEVNPEFTLTYEGWKNNETEDVLTKKPTATTTATKESEPGEYEVTVSGGESQNYELSYTNGKLIVTEADPVTITAKSYTREYGEDNPTFEYTSKGVTLIGTPEITCEATATSPVGTYPIVIKKGSVTNYNDTYVNGTLTIKKASLTVKVENVTREQYVENPEFVITYSGWKLNEDESVLTKKPTATTTATKDSPVGTYDIVVSGGEARNYELKYQNGVLTVTESTGIATISVTKPVNVYNVQGRMVRSKATTLEGLPSGVYIVNGQKVIVK